MHDEREKLSALGLQSVEDLYSAVPPQLRENAELKFAVGTLPSSTAGRGLSEDELRNQFTALAAKNFPLPPNRSFLGGGHFLSARPAVEATLARREEFQWPPSSGRPEAAQGTLQALHEFQTQIASLTGFPLAAAALDGNSALCEAVALADKTGPVFVAASVAPQTRAVLRTFLGDRLVPLPWKPDGTLDNEALASRAKETPPALLIVASPNYFGIIEALAEIAEALPDGALLAAHCCDPSSLALFEPPGALGPDLATGDARELGMPLLFGGNSVGYLAASESLLLRTGGSLARKEAEGDGAIYRLSGGATECPQALAALRASLHLSVLGTVGFQRLAERHFSHFDYIAREMERVGIPLKFLGATHYREGVFEIPNLDSRFQKALERGIVPGICLAPRFAGTSGELSNCLLVGVNAGHRKADLDELVEVMSDD